MIETYGAWWAFVLARTEVTRPPIIAGSTDDPATWITQPPQEEHPMSDLDTWLDPVRAPDPDVGLSPRLVALRDATAAPAPSRARQTRIQNLEVRANTIAACIEDIDRYREHAAGATLNNPEIIKVLDRIILAERTRLRDMHRQVLRDLSTLRRAGAA